MACLKAVIYTCMTFCLLAEANIFKGTPKNLPITEENSAKVRNALLSVIVSNSAAFSVNRLLPEHNVIFSPLSISNSLAVLYLGAKELTASEMEDSLGFNATFLHDGFLSIRQSMTEDVEECESHALNFATALVSSSNHSIDIDYQRESRFYYAAEVLQYPRAAESESVLNQVNSWISNVTGGKINTVITDPPSSSTSLIVLNALYFKAPWKYPFDPLRTLKKTFYNYGYKNVEVPMMHRTVKALYGYHPDVDAFVLILPYSGLDVDAVFLLPRQRSGLHKLESSLSVDVYNTLQQVVYNTEVEIAIPKLKLSNALELLRVVRSLGVEKLFTAGADLSGIDPENNLYVSQLVHKTVFELTESGTEAASTTRANVQTLSLKPTFYLNHPFMFLVKHRWTGAILFLGRVQEL